MSNFDFFTNEYEELSKIGETAEILAYLAPSAAVGKIRLLAEKITEIVMNMEDLQIDSEHDNQFNRLRYLEDRDIISDKISQAFHTIRKVGNDAIHDGKYDTPNAAIAVIKFGYFISCWFMEVYVDFSFEASKFDEPKDIYKLKEEELRKEKEKTEELSKINKLLKTKLESNGTLAERKQKSKEYNENSEELTEAQTRLIIDEKLTAMGFIADSENLNYKKHKTMPEKNKNMAIAEWPCGNDWADYALFVGTKLVGIVEAKKMSEDVPGHLEQAKEYAMEVEQMLGTELCEMHGKYKVPFIYATNGREYIEQLKLKSGIWFFDTRKETNIPYALENWHSPNDLEAKLKINVTEANEKLAEDDDYPEFVGGMGRTYQIEAIKAVEEAMIDEHNHFIDDKKRMLLAMATGTGKTRTALGIIYRLLKTKRVNRILFLVDREALGTQTVDALKDSKVENLSLADIYPVEDLKTQYPDLATKVQIATVQGMVQRLFNNDNNKLSAGTYDFIIVDEAHRGYKEDKEMTDDELKYYEASDYMSKYRRVIDYFDAAVLGLTATPALHTTKIFGMPIYQYTYSDAVVDGFLIDHGAPYIIETELMNKGINFEKGEQVNLFDNDNGNIEFAQVEDELNFDVEDFNKKIINESFNKTVVDELTNHIDPNEQEKTLIFAARDVHADMIVDLLKQSYREKGFNVPEDAIAKITSNVKNNNKLIKSFKNETYPNIVVTVDLLTTGVDVPKISNLVFLRRVKSRILYEQMLGRATRLCPEINKDEFKIFDAVHLYNTLEKVTAMKPVVSTPKITIDKLVENIENTDDDEAFEFYKKELLAKMQRQKQRMTEEKQREVARLNDEKSLDKWLHKLKSMNKDEFSKEVKKIYLFSRYDIPKNKAIIDNTHEDKLISVERSYGAGNTKPEDYLEAFDEFVRTHINEIPALNVLVNRPKDLTIAELNEIKNELLKNDFKEKNLQEAYQKATNKHIIVDIISFIRRAALGTELVSHEERIKKAMQKVYELNNWTDIQKRWLERIEKQLLEQNILGPNAKVAFSDIPQFRNQGGYKRMKQTFGDNTEKIIEVLNDNLYA